MFKKLRIKLTFFNIGVIGSILLILTITIFFGSPSYDSSIISEEMWKVALNGIKQTSKDKPLGHRYHEKNIIYIAMDRKENIIEKVSYKRISEENIKTLVYKALDSNENSGKVKIQENQAYLFLKVILNENQGITLVFEELKSNVDSFISFFSKSILIIIFSLILVFFGSLFISEKALIPIKKAWEKQVDFTADASHELRTPIAVIQTNLELVMGNDKETVESQKKWLENIFIETNRMAKLVGDLLTLARADTEQQPLELNNFMLDEVLEKAIVPLEPLAVAQEKILKKCLEPKVDFYGDSSRLKQLIIILIDNALKYTDRNGQVDLILEKNHKEIKIIVRDNGIGIEKEHLIKIFDRFYRVDKARVRDKGGSGLGLALAKWIVEEHRGVIKVNSTPRKGTEFIVSLPNREIRNS